MSSVLYGGTGHSHGDGSTAIVTVDGVSEPLVNYAVLCCTTLAPLYSDARYGAITVGSKHASEGVVSVNIAA